MNCLLNSHPVLIKGIRKITLFVSLLSLALGSAEYRLPIERSLAHASLDYIPHEHLFVFIALKLGELQNRIWSTALFYLNPAANQSINKVIGYSPSKLEANIAYIQLLMCSFSEGWRTELPCSSLSLTRKDDVVLAELRAKIAAASVKGRAVLLLDFWGLSRRQMLQFVIYKINHRAAFCWKARSYLGRKKTGRKRRRKTWGVGENKGRAQIQLEKSVLSCRSASPHCLGFILPFVIFSVIFSQGDVPAESMSKGKPSARSCCCL